MLYVSRYSNPELKKGIYTAVRISIGVPKWPLGYQITGEISDLMPWGMLNKYSHEEFVVRYREKLENIGVEKIRRYLRSYERIGKPVVLLCYEDIRVKGQTCHRTTFAEWWKEKTGEDVKELEDPSIPKGEKVETKNQSVSKAELRAKKRNEELIKQREMELAQISVFDLLI